MTNSDTVPGEGHTKGPWTFAPFEEPEYGDPEWAKFTIKADDDDNFCLATIIGDISDIPAEANARLIAAAPDLLEVLIAIHHQLVKQGINFGPLIADAEAAIAKAQGGQP